MAGWISGHKGGGEGVRARVCMCERVCTRSWRFPTLTVRSGEEGSMVDPKDVEREPRPPRGL